MRWDFPDWLFKISLYGQKHCGLCWIRQEDENHISTWPEDQWGLPGHLRWIQSPPRVSANGRPCISRMAREKEFHPRARSHPSRRSLRDCRLLGDPSARPPSPSCEQVLSFFSNTLGGIKWPGLSIEPASNKSVSQDGAATPGLHSLRPHDPGSAVRASRKSCLRCR